MVSSPSTMPRSIRVLLAEDNTADAALVLEAFKGSSRPIRVIRVKDGEEVLSYLRGKGFEMGERPDLILLDLNMPRKNGFEVLEEVKSDPQFAAIPIVVLTNSHLESDVRKAYEDKANFYLVKPPGLEDFFTAMRKVEEIWLGGINSGED